MWIQRLTAPERRTLAAAFAGYGLDGFDTMIYSFVIPTLLALWGMSKAEAGTIAAGALLTSAVGGWGAGVLADRYGRARVLQWTVAWFAAFTFLSGFADSFHQLLFTRSMQGFGFGGEWSVGAVLIAETVDARHRGRAAGLVQSSWAIGWALAACAFWGSYACLRPELAWRVLFLIGVMPSMLIVYIRRSVREPAAFLAAKARAQEGSAGRFLDIFRRPLRRTTVLSSLLSGGMLGAYYSVTTWLPTYLRTERGLSLAGTAGYLLILIAGSFAGYLTSAWLSDKLGRRRCFVLFAVCGIFSVIAYTQLPVGAALALALGFPLGFFSSGIFSGMGAFLAELYPDRVRGSGQGFAYNVGRALGAVCPALIGRSSGFLSLADAIGATTSIAYLLVIAAALALPETRGCALPEEIGP